MRTIIATFFFTLFLYVNNLYSQCSWNTSWSQYPSATQSTSVNTWTTVTTLNYAGDYSLYNVTIGNTYEWSLCASDGGNCSYDGYITLFNGSTNAVITFNDDGCGAGGDPKIAWIATFTGTVKVLITAYQCNTNTINTTLVWRCSSSGATTNDLCHNAIQLTVSDSCIYTTGSISGATQSLTGCSGTANDDVWYSFVATSSTQNISVTGSANFDPVFQVYYGTCASLSSLICKDATTDGGTESATLTGLAVGNTYLMRIYDYGSDIPATPTFDICIYGGSNGGQPNTGDCLGAIKVCNNLYNYSGSIAGIGNIDDLGTVTPCGTYEKNSTWYTFSVITAGNFMFTLNSSTDYDWALYDITQPASCNDIFEGTLNPVRCNWSQTVGNTGMSNAGTNTSEGAVGIVWCSPLAVTQGQTFALLVDNYNGGTVGYSLDFGTGTASIIDNSPPYLLQIVDTPSCGQNTITFSFNENVEVASVSINDFTVTSGSNTYFIDSISSLNDSIFDDTYIVTLSSGIVASGTYSLNLAGQVNDACGNAVSVNSLTFNVSGITVDYTLSNPSCFNGNDGTIALSINGEIPPYTYQWSNGATTSLITDLSVGDYTVTVTDNNGLGACSVIQTISLQNKNILFFENFDTIPVLGWTSGATGTNSWVLGQPQGGRGSSVISNSDPTIDYSSSSTNNVYGQGLGTGSLGGYNNSSNEWLKTPAINCSGTSNVLLSFWRWANFESNYDEAYVEISTNGTNWFNLLQPMYPTDNAWTNVIIDISQYADNQPTVYVRWRSTSDGSTTYSGWNIDDVEIFTSLDSISSNLITTDVLCNGQNTGSINLNVSGGTPSYSFNWSNGQTSQNISSLNAGIYSVTITDANMCQRVDSVEITEPDSIFFILSVTQPLCSANNGAIDLTVMGGTTSYFYNWSSGQTTQDIASLNSGTYYLTVTDSNSCVEIDSVTLNQQLALTLSATFTEPTCNMSDGTIDLTVNGGAPPYSYNWSNGQTTEDISLLSYGIYAVTISDSVGCSDTLITILNNNLAPNISLTNLTNILCNNQNNGSIDISISGGTSPYSIFWSNTSTDEDLTNLIAGNYNITVTDALLCNSIATYTINQPDSVVLSLNITDVTCHGDSTGAIDLTVTGGVFPYSYIWSTGDTTSNIENLTSNNYSVTVTDANNCTENIIGNITEPSALIIFTSRTNVSCYGLCDGSANVSVSGGSGYYNYVWSNALATNSINNLCAGMYSVTVYDANSTPECYTTANVSVSEPAEIILTTSSINSNCGSSDGSAIVVVNNSSTNYTYNWVWVSGSNTSTSVLNTDTVYSLPAGTVYVTVTIDYGCSNVAIININENLGISSSITSTNATSYGTCDGTATVTFSGGTSPYTYLWDALAGNQTTATATGLCAGNYSVTIMDSNGCTSIKSVTISQPASVLSVSVSLQTNVICNGTSTGSVTISVSGGTVPYVYNWSGTPTGDGTTTITGLTAGIYSVTVTDANSDFATVSVTITQPPILLTSCVATNIHCNGENNGLIDLTPSGGNPPYTYLWSNGSANQDLINIGAGVYSITVTDLYGCTATNSVTIAEPSALVLNANSTNATCGNSNGSIDLSVSGGTSPYVYNWSGTPTGDGTNAISNLQSGTYTVTVTDSNGCTKLTSINVWDENGPSISNSSSSSVTCYGDSTGYATISVSGGTPNYDYHWSNGSSIFNTSSTSCAITALPAGVYTVTVSDANGCSVFTSIMISQPTALMATIYSQTNTLCYGSNNGSASVIAAGGTPPYSYQWGDSLFQTTSTANNLYAGTYTVTVTDNQSCTTIKSVNIFQPTQINISIISQTNTCVNDSTGAINIDVSGGSGIYSFQWSNGETTPNIANLSEGTYTIIITDINNCSAIDSVTITQQDFANISGNVLFSGGFVAAGDAEINLYNADVPGFNVIANTILGNNGSFNINDISQGNYWLKVDLLNHSGYPQLFNTYYDSTYKWFEATTLSLICGDSLNLSITMAENFAQSIGNGTINGNIVWVSNNKAINGIPVTGADFILETEPDNEPVTETISDISGNYSMADISYGSYSIYVDIPGIPLITTHNFIINATDSVFNNLNFYVDTITNFGIYADTVPLNIPLIAENFTINVNPNPFNNEININYSINKTCDVSIELFDITGKKISSLQNSKHEKGNYSMKYNNTKDSVKPGVYFLKIIVSNEVYVKKIVKE